MLTTKFCNHRGHPDNYLALNHCIQPKNFENKELAECAPTMGEDLFLD